MMAAQSGVKSGVWGRLKELRIPFDPSVVTGLFDAITAAAGLCGCEVWSTCFLGDWHLEARLCRLQSYQATVYKHSLGVPGSTASLLTLLVQQGPSLLGSTLLANVASGLDQPGPNRRN
jgi:hypothetical protein